MAVPINIRDDRPACQVTGHHRTGEVQMPDTLRPMRADARRNRERILEVAFATFAAEGLSVPVQETARRPGGGRGPGSSPSPTRESLFEAVVLTRAAGLAEQAARLARK